MLEQQLAAVVSAPVSIPLGLAASACAALVVAALLLQSIVLRQRRSKTGSHAAAMPAAMPKANGLSAAGGKEDAPTGIPSAEQLLKLISTRRSIFPKVAAVTQQRIVCVAFEMLPGWLLNLCGAGRRRTTMATSYPRVICRCDRRRSCSSSYAQ